MNSNLKLDLNMQTLKTILPGLLKALPTIVGVALVAIFGYTAYVLNSEVNVQAAPTQSTLAPLPKITFNQKVINNLTQRQSVNGQVPVNLGTNNPFSQ